MSTDATSSYGKPHASEDVLEAPLYPAAINSSVALANDLAFFKTLGLSFAAGVVCIALSIGGLALWHEADYFHDPGPYAQNSWCGYDKRTFVGLVMLTAFSTLGFTLLYTAVYQAQRVSPNFMSVFAFCAVGFFCIAAGCTGMVWAKEMWKCVGIFCVGTDYTEIPNARPEAGLGFLVTVGTFAFLSLVPFGLIIVGTGARSALKRQHGYAAVATPSVTTAAQPDDALALTVRTLLVLLAILLFGFTTTYVPNSWESIVAARIAKNANLRVSLNGTLCNDEYNLYTCPEVSWAVYATTTVEVSERFVLKFYPGNVFFFVYLLALVMFVSILRMNRFGRLFLKSSISCHISGRTFKRFFNWTVGEVLLFVATLVLFVNFFVYWFHDHNYNGYWVGGEERNITDSERWARTLGQVAVLFMSLLFFPASRNSVMHHMLGTSWESFLWAHRVLGYLTLATIFGHMVAWYKFYSLLGFFPRDIFDVPLETPTSIDNFTVPLNTLTTFFMFIAMGVLALNPIRRRCFELFYYSHILAAYMAIPAVLWHAAAGWEYLLPGITVWFMDRCVRLARSNQPVTVVSVRRVQDCTEIKWSQPDMTAMAGQYVFLNVPEISLFEWHPFTLSSGGGSEHFSVLIKPMGANSWTQRLSSLASAGGNVSLSLAVDGPYGHAITYQDYQRVILVAGGIGITPCASIYKTLKTSPMTRPVVLWSLREEMLVTAFQDQFAPDMPRVQEHQDSTQQRVLDNVPARDATVRVFLTTKGTVNKAVAGVAGVQVVAGGRMDMRVELQQLSHGYAPDQVLVFVCGPEPMVVQAQELANHFGFHFHRETFLL